MADPRTLLLLTGQPPNGEPNPWPQLVLMGLIFAIFYFILILPMRQKQRKVEEMVKSLKTGDKVIVSPGIFGTIVGVEDDAFQVRIDEKTRIKVLRSAVGGPQGPETTKTEKEMPAGLENPYPLWFVLTAALAGLAYAFVRKELQVRAIFYGGFLIACLILIWPPYERDGQPGKIKLGLDLRGGMHLVLQVVVDDALNATIDDAVQTARDQATRKAIVFGSASRGNATSFAVEGVEPARVKDMREILRDFFRADWEIREPGENRFLVQM